MEKRNQMKSILSNLIENKMFAGVLSIERVYLVDLEGELVGKFHLELGEEQLREKDSHLQKDVESVLKRNLSIQAIDLIKIREVFHYLLPIDDGITVICYLVIPALSEKEGLKPYLELLRTLLRNSILQYRDIEQDFLSSDLQRQLCENFSEGYLTMNVDGKIMYVNAAGSQILNKPVSSIVGTVLGEVVHSSTDILALIQENRVIKEKEIFFQVDGTKIMVVVTAIPLRASNNLPIGILLVFNALQNIRKKLNNLVGASARFTFEQILHQSEKMNRLVEMAKRSAINDSSILIEGESGTGKEMIAQAIHNHSKRKEGPFVTIDCSSIPRELIESELFGYVEGAFTGTQKGGRIGKFELANGGTIFLDEIGEMPLEMQVRLLRVIQNRMVTRVGSNEEIPIDVRIISATNRDLEEEVENNNFRLDLFYRLNVIQLKVPSLKERIGDLSLLINAFIQKASLRENMAIPHISSEALYYLENYRWPGNIRELENAIERAVILCQGTIKGEHLPERVTHQKELKHLKIASKVAAPATIKTLKEVEKVTIANAIRAANGNITLAAKYLDISRTTIYKHINEMGIKIEK